MCGRYVLFKSIAEIAAFLDAADTSYFETEEHSFRPSYNAAPSVEMPIAFTGDGGERVLQAANWGFMKWKPKPGEKPFLPINARAESVAGNKLWRDSFMQSRCIVPVNGFYEWSGAKGNKTPHYIYPKKDSLFGLAGICSDLAPEGKSVSRSYAIITTPPNRLMEGIHDRMPAILHPEEFDDWLNPANNSNPQYLAEFLRPYPDDAMQEHIVSKAVGNVRFNEPGLIQKAELF